jgi:hypothetical protein
MFFNVLKVYPKDEFKICIAHTLVPVAYVGVKKGHPLFGMSEKDAKISCHGGITFVGYRQEVDPEKEFWFFGWDYGHGDDMMQDGPVMFDRIVKGLPPIMTKEKLKQIEDECLDVLKQLEDARVKNG